MTSTFETNFLTEIESKNRKEINMDSLLNTNMWVHTNDSVDEQLEYDENKITINSALATLFKYNIKVVEKNTIKYGKVWLAMCDSSTDIVDENVYVMEEEEEEEEEEEDEDEDENEKKIKQACRFVNDKIYILNPSRKNSFLYPELKSLSKSKTKSKYESIPFLEGGSTNDTQGTTSAILNTIIINNKINKINEMTGGDIATDSAIAASEIQIDINKYIDQNNLKLSENQKSELNSMIQKQSKYTERLNLIANYLHEYSQLPQAEKDENETNLKTIVDKFDRLNKKSKKSNNNMLRFYKNLDSDKSSVKELKTKSIRSFNIEKIYDYLSNITKDTIFFDVFKLNKFCTEFKNNKNNEKTADDSLEKLFTSLFDSNADYSITELEDIRDKVFNKYITITEKGNQIAKEHSKNYNEYGDILARRISMIRDQEDDMTRKSRSF